MSLYNIINGANPTTFFILPIKMLTNEGSNLIAANCFIKRFIMRKSIEELRKLNTKNLLRYYKAERRRFYGAGYWCSCGCGEMIWEARTSQADMEQKYNEHKDFLCLIKTELDTREHVS